jgi:hypothetical protein
MISMMETMNVLILMIENREDYQNEKGSKIKKTQIMRESAASRNVLGSSSRIAIFIYTGTAGPS